ncbi:hypothetical protein GCM10023258_38130 [Terrabacter aeriphilus]|uniref:DUF4232 domain-containing protein n=2 Tax=Terrabacter aeriphilus TaxID=515662 RepID=A0ABP9JNQ4_9MICO
MLPQALPVASRALRPAVALALGAVLVTSACGSSTPSSVATPAGGGDATPATTEAGSGAETVGANGIRLEAQLAPGGPGGVAVGAGIAATPGYVVQYTVTNTTSEPVLARDVVPRDLGSATLAADVDREHVWVYEQDGVLRLSKQGFAPAPNVRFAAAPVVGGHTIAPGASLTGRAYAVSPPRLHVPAESFEAPRTPVDPSVAQWQFCLQVDGEVAQARPSAVGDGVVQVAATAPAGDDLVCTPATPIPRA